MVSLRKAGSCTQSPTGHTLEAGCGSDCLLLEIVAWRYCAKVLRHGARTQTEKAAALKEVEQGHAKYNMSTMICGLLLRAKYAKAQQPCDTMQIDSYD